MEVQDGVGISDGAVLPYGLHQLRFSNATTSSFYNRNEMELLTNGNRKDVFAPSASDFVNRESYSDMPEDDEMDTEVKRLSSFKNWPASSPIKPKDLAAAGFYFVGRDDQVRCFRCDLYLRKWEKDDVPWEEHKRNRPRCPFVRQKLLEEREHFNITCKPVEASFSRNEVPTLSLPGKDVHPSQFEHHAAASFQESSCLGNFQPSAAASVYRQSETYETSKNYPRTGFSCQYPKTNRASMGQSQATFYSGDEYHTNIGSLQSASKQPCQREEPNLPQYSFTINSGEILSVPKTTNPAFTFPNQYSFAKNDPNSGFEYETNPNSFKDATIQINEQKWHPTKDPTYKNVFEESQQMLPSQERRNFVLPNEQKNTSTAQRQPWLGGYSAAQSTGRVVNNSNPSVVFNQGGLQQKPLFRQEGVRHGSSVAELQSEHHRLTTFVDWPQNSPINPCELASAGFYYLGTGDNVKCYKCGCALCNWDPNDTPWSEHLKWSPNCPLVLEHFKGRRALGPVEGTELTLPKRNESNDPQISSAQQFQPKQKPSISFPQSGQSVYPQHVEENIDMVSSGTLSKTNFYEKLQPPSKSVFTFTKPVTVTHPASKTFCSESPTSPNYQQTQVEDSSLLSMPSLYLTSKDIDHILDMGFSRGVIDEVVSAQLANTGQPFRSVDELTNAVLEYGEKNVPSSSTNNKLAKLHATSPKPQSPVSPPCPRREITGIEDNHHTFSYDAETFEAQKQSPKNIQLSLESTSTNIESGEHELLEKRLERMQEERTCKICMDAPIGVVFLPCGHLICCPNCASGIELCPMCRRPIQESVRTYMS